MRRKRKGIVGIEAAIVMIAFVIVAAALAFVALNMGMFTTQKSKETIARGLGEASTALEVDGSVTGNVTTKNNEAGVDAILIPIKVAPGREGVDLKLNRTSVRLIVTSPDGTSSAYENIYSGVNTSLANKYPIGISNITNTFDANKEAEAVLVILRGDTDNVLEFGEKAVLAVKLPDTYGPYTKIAVELRVADGAPLTIERLVPASLPDSGAVDMG
ncbi:MAG: flagellin [Desulfurococcales archaeon]|nr:flagellin [Desulfurococcales archaeon]